MATTVAKKDYKKFSNNITNEKDDAEDDMEMYDIKTKDSSRS